ncbi:MAG: PDDEXK nuclease domain-containing protein [Bacteroidales bacterium]|nr:PDDEXK nuclease domain-containing protein [Bacteroidales bacterium]
MKNNKSLIIQYNKAAETIKTAILQSQYEAAKSVNRIQLALYFGIGKFLSINTRKGEWGTSSLSAISEKLQKDLPGLRGFSATSLKKMRLFYENWNELDSISSVATDEINNIIIPTVLNFKLDKDFPIEDFFRVPFTHHSEILSRVKDEKARFYYIHRTAEEHLSVEQLVKLIKENTFEHNYTIPNNFSKTVSNVVMARKAVMMFKDEYLLDFINVEEIDERESIDIDERVVEKQIINNVKKFIMTFGNDFAFIGNQYHLEVHGIDHFPDLLFFNRELNAIVVVELKTGEFKSSYLGQLMSYLSILDVKVKKSHENPSIGIVLCKSANRDYVEFVIQDYNKPMGVATYTTSSEMPEKLRKALPDIEELKKIL